MPKKTSKMQGKGKGPRNTTAVVTLPKAKNKSQRAIAGAMEAGLALMTGNKVQAALSAASAVYDIAGMSGGPSARTVTAPASKGSIVRSSGSTMPKSISTGPDTIRVTGRAEIMRLEIGVLGYYAYAVNGDFYTINTSNPPLILSMCPPGANPFAGSIATQPFGANFTTPVRLRNIAQSYALWRYENVRFSYVPVVSTATSGSVSLAWTPQNNATLLSATTTPDIWGPTPNSPLVLSQLAHFVQTPAWQTASLSVSPRRHGVAENAKDWLSVVYNGSATSNGSAGLFNVPSFCGGLSVQMSDFATPLTAYTAGYLMMDYDVSFHESVPLTNLSALYTVTDFLYSPINSDLFEELKRRRMEEKKECGGDAGKVFEYRMQQRRGRLRYGLDEDDSEDYEESKSGRKTPVPALTVSKGVR